MLLLLYILPCGINNCQNCQAILGRCRLCRLPAVQLASVPLESKQVIAGSDAREAIRTGTLPRWANTSRTTLHVCSSADRPGRDRRRARFCIQTFSLRPLPNRACHFHGTRLSSFRESPDVGVLHYAAFILLLPSSLFPFPMSEALPSAFGYYGDSVALGLASGRRSHICV